MIDSDVEKGDPLVVPAPPDKADWQIIWSAPSMTVERLFA
jgi:hypothetical protein